MYILNRGASRGFVSCSLIWMTPRRLMMSSVATVVSYVAFLAIWAWAGHGFTSADAGRPGIDFATFWTASHVALQGSPLRYTTT